MIKTIGKSLSKINFEKKYITNVTIVVVASAVFLVWLILFEDMTIYKNQFMFTIITICDGFIFIDMIDVIYSQKNKKE
jgi:hypothetical protein